MVRQGRQLGHFTSLTCGKAWKDLNEIVRLNIQKRGKIDGQENSHSFAHKMFAYLDCCPSIGVSEHGPMITTCIESKILLYYFP